MNLENIESGIFEQTQMGGIKRALQKKAVGFYMTETVKEYIVSEDAQMQLCKQKKTRKYVAPDISAIKLYCLLYAEKEVEQMSEEELRAERARLMELIEKEKEES